MTATKGRVYCGVIWILCLCLSFTIARQVLDFMGHMWLAIIVNFLHIIMVIFGLFGAVQFRPSFLGAFLLWCCAWIAWNLFIACFYLNVGSLVAENVPKILGFDTHGSKSFWIEHTPLCKSEYNLDLNIWQELEDCYFSYRYVEAITAIFHSILGLLAFCFIVAFLTRMEKSRTPRNYRSTPRNRQPRITMEFTDPEEDRQNHQNGKISYEPAPNGYQSDAYDASSGYLNTSFEPGSPSPSVMKQNGFVPALDKNGLLIQKYKLADPGRRSSKKRKKRAQEQKEIIRSARNASPTDDDPTIDSIPVQHVRHATPRDEQFSEATTVQVLDEELAARRRARSHSSARQKKEDKEQRRNRRTRSVSPLTRQKRAMHHNSTTTLESRVSPDSGVPATMNSDRMYRPRSTSKSRAHKLYAAPGHLHQRHGGSQDSTLVASRLAREYHDPDCDLQQRFIAEPRRLSVTEPRGIRNSNDSVLNGKSYQKSRSSNSNLQQQSPERAIINPPLTSLVSFDPKSNTLIRYHDHLARSQEAVNPHDTTQGTDESESLPPLPTEVQLRQHGAINSNHYSANFDDRKRNQLHSNGKLLNAPSSDRVSYDSGHPPSSIIYNNDQWSSQGSSGSSDLYGHGQKALLPPRKPIGYEPSVADVDPSTFRIAPQPIPHPEDNQVHRNHPQNYPSSDYGYSSRSNNFAPNPSRQIKSDNGPPPYREPFPNISYQPSYQERMAAMDNSDDCDIHLLPPPPCPSSSGPRLAPVRDGVLMAYDDDEAIPPPEPIIKTIPISSRGQFLPTLTAQLSTERLNELPDSKLRSSNSDYGYSTTRKDDEYSGDSIESSGFTDAPLINNNSLLV